MVGDLMAKFKVGTGIEQYVKSLETLEKATTDMIGKAIYNGADIVADAVRSAIQAVPIESSKAAAAAGTMVSGLSAAQKGGLLSGLGVSHMQSDGGLYNVKVGFDGYNTIKTKRWPNGQPNSMIARSMESGTSFRAKNPVISKATRAVKEKAERVMAETLDREIEARINF